MSDKKTYVVETEYRVKDDASNHLHKIGEAAHEAGEHAESLKEVLHEVGETFLIFEGVEKAKELFIGFNAEVQTAKIQLQSAIGVNFKKSWEQAGEVSNEFFEDFEKMAEEFPVSAKELAESAQQIGVGVAKAHGNMEDLVLITERGAIAQKAFGLSSRELMLALEGRVRASSTGGAALLNAVGMNPEQWRKLTAESRLQLTKKFLQSDMLTKAGEEISGSFAGQASILKDRLEVAAGKVGLPLFKALNEELKGWNEWLTKNADKIEHMGHVVGEKLVEGFEVLKDVASFLYSHADILIKIGEAWAIGKGVEAISKVGHSIGESGVGKLGTKIGEKLVEKLPALGKIGSAIGSVVGGAAAWAPLAIPVGQYLGDSLGRAVFPSVVALEKLEKASQHLTETMAGTAKEMIEKFGGKSAMGTAAFGRAHAMRELDEQRIGALKHILKTGEYDEDKLYNLQFTKDEIGKLRSNRHGKIVGNRMMAAGMIGEMEETAERKSSELGFKTGNIELGFRILQMGMSKDQRESINVQKSMEKLMVAQLRLWATEHRFLSQDEMKKMVLEDKELFNEQAKVNQTVNVTIQQVSAKDPDRWIADMDDYAARRVRARTKARGAMARGH